MSITDDIAHAYCDMCDGFMTVQLQEGQRIGLICAVVDAEDEETSALLFDISPGPDGPIVSIKAFARTGKPAELARLEGGAGSMLFHVLP